MLHLLTSLYVTSLKIESGVKLADDFCKTPSGLETLNESEFQFEGWKTD